MEDAFPKINPFSKNNIEFAVNLANIISPRPDKRPSNVSYDEYIALAKEFQKMKNTADKAIEKCKYIEADRDAAYNTIGKLRRTYNIPLTPDDLEKIIDTDRNNILSERGYK